MPHVRPGLETMLITDKDKKWLSSKYPGLKSKQNKISGLVEFTAAYDTDANCFRVIDKDTADEVKGLRLSGKFKIKIEERTNKSLSKLPTVFVEEVDHTSSRHFNQTDQSACLCSPLEEEEFLSPEFLFQPFFTKLVIPFLYGQIFYSEKGYWPWTEYGHGVVGLLESYFKANDPSKAQDCLDKLSKQDKQTWEKVQATLQRKSGIKGHTACFCPKMDHIRRCHPDAWKGILKLREDLKNQNIDLESLRIP